jgi:hypothetical protein
MRTTGLTGAFQQGQQRGRQANLIGSLAGGAPREQVLSDLAHVDPMMAGREMGMFTSGNKKEDPTKKKTRELEQLWKDANRSLNHARSIGDTANIEYYENLQKKLMVPLSQLRPEIWGSGSPTETATTTEATVETPSADFTEIRTQVQAGAVDTDNDGIIDNVSNWKDGVTQWARKQGVPTNSPEYIDLLAYMDNLEAEVAKKKDAKLSKEDLAYRRQREKKTEERTSSKDRILEDEKFQKSWVAMNKLKKDPKITNKRAALNVALRKETGAAIGADEFTDMMSFVLPEVAYNQFKNETTGLGQQLLGMASENARETYLKKLVEKYLSKVDHNKLADYIDSSISSEYYKRKESKPKGGRFSKFNKGKK